MSIKRIMVKTLKRVFITLGIVLVLLIAIPFLFPQAINRKINTWVNSNINGKMTFTGTRLSFFKHFPSLTLVLDNVTLAGPAPFQDDTLIKAKSIGLGIDLVSVFKSDLTINKIFLYKASINIQVDSDGSANYNVYKKRSQNVAAPADSSGASLGIKKILIEESNLVYNDRSIPMVVNARGLNYTGSGDLSKDIFDLNTHADIQSFDFYFNNQPYILSKKINADLVTQINTKSLSFIFQKNELMINQLPVEFNGRFGFLKDGYDMDFHIDSHEKDINVIISALPPDYQKMFDKTDISGLGNIQVALTGKYIAKDSIMPDLTMNLKITNGMVNNEKSPSPVKNLYVSMNAKLPGLNTDSLSVNVDSLHLNVADGYLNAVLKDKGVNVPDIYARVNAEIDLGKWNKALGIKKFNAKGLCSFNLLAQGKYAKEVVRTGKLRKKLDTVITSIPEFELTSSFKDGYFKYNSLPEVVDHIGFRLRARCPDNNYKHISVVLDDLDISALGSFIKGAVKLGNEDNFPIDAALNAKIHLEDLEKFYPVDSLVLKGDLNASIIAKGNFVPDKKMYPVVDARFALHNGLVKTKYYPHPIENISVDAGFADSLGSLRGLQVVVDTVGFSFEDEPFSIKARLKDFTDLQYKVKLKGKLDIGKIYQVFARKGYNVTGIVKADLSMKGRQSDATAGNYDKLSNKGSLRLKNVSVTTDIYPKPFLISRGALRFKDDKVRLDTFIVNYSNSTIVFNGAVSNFIDYFIKPGSVLNGELDMTSDAIAVDDFMVAADTTHPAPAYVQSVVAAPPSGVVMVPANLDLIFNANVGQITYCGTVINNFTGQMCVRNDSIVLKETGFNIIGAPIEMDAAYTAINTQKAWFTYHISAKDFDIHKAYTNIRMFHDMATSAEHADGLVSLDYELSGNLNSNMAPIYPSLVGGGTVSADKIKMHGFKLFNAIGKESRRDSLNGESEAAMVTIKSSIANNIITIERTKMRMAGFRARFEGQVSFDKTINLRFKLGLPPGGLVSIPMTITGTEDNPKVQVGKDKDEAIITEKTGDIDD